MILNKVAFITSLAKTESKMIYTPRVDGFQVKTWLSNSKEKASKVKLNRMKFIDFGNDIFN